MPFHYFSRFFPATALLIVVSAYTSACGFVPGPDSQDANRQRRARAVVEGAVTSMASGDIAGAAALACPEVGQQWTDAAAELEDVTTRHRPEWGTAHGISAHTRDDATGDLDVTYQVDGHDSGWVISVVDDPDGNPRVCGSHSRASETPPILRAVGERTVVSNVGAVIDIGVPAEQRPPNGYRPYSDGQVDDAPSGTTRTVAFRKDDEHALRLTALQYDTPSAAARAVDRELDRLQPELLDLDRHSDGFQATIAAYGWLLAQPTNSGPYLVVARLAQGRVVLEARATDPNRITATALACASLRGMIPDGTPGTQTCGT